MPPATGILPHYLLLDPEEGLLLLNRPNRAFWQSDVFALGCAWAVTPRNIEACAEQVCIEMSRLHEGLLGNMPIGTAVQGLMRIQPGRSIPAWEKARAAIHGDPLVDSQRAAIHNGLPYQDSFANPHCLRDFSTLFTLRMPMPEMTGPIQHVLETCLRPGRRPGAALRRYLTRELGPAVDRFAGIGHNVEQALRAAGHGLKRLDGQGLGEEIAAALHPIEQHPIGIVTDIPLHRQVVRHYLKRIDGGFLLDEDAEDPLAVQVLSLLNTPEQTFPGMISSTRAPKDGKPLEPWTAWDGPMVIATNIAIANSVAVKTRLERRSWFAKRHKETNAANRVLDKELDEIMGRLSLTGEALPAMRMHIALYGSKAALPGGVSNMILRAGTLKLNLHHERHAYGSSLFLHTLPLGFDPKWPSKKVINRDLDTTAGNAGDFLPFFGASRGTRTGGVYYLNRRGEAMTYHLFDSNTNPHFAVVGNSGSGKTYWTTHMLSHLLSLGLSVFVVDPLQNFRDLCVERGGTLHVVSFDHPPCFNPFFGDFSREHQGYICAFIKHLASGAGAKMDWAEFTTLGKAVGHFLSQWDRGRGEPTLGAFVTECLLPGQFEGATPRQERQAASIAERLGLFYGDGMYAPFVDGPNTFKITKGLTVIELSSFERHQDLRGVLFFALVYAFFKFFEDPEWRYEHKAVIFDEVWGLDDMPETEKEVGRIVRTARNKYTAAGFISQRGEDYATSMGAVIRDIAGTNIFLKPMDGQMETLTDLFKLTPDEVQLFEHIEITNTSSSFYLRLAERRGGIARLISDPYFHLMQTQEAAVAQRRDAAKVQFQGNVREAIQSLLKKVA